MQLLPTEIISQAREEKMKSLDKELKEFVKGCVVGERILCPRCQYSSKKNKCSAVIFKDSIKCFACGLWRKI
jgi:hypothetical protein